LRGGSRSRPSSFPTCRGARKHVSKADIAAIVDTSLARLASKVLDLVQFHWWEYARPRYPRRARLARRAAPRGQGAPYRHDQLRYLRGLREMFAAGISARDAPAAMVGVRPAARARAWPNSAACAASRFFATARLPAVSSTSAGSAPRIRRPPLANRSLVKYRLILEEFGAGARFQRMLEPLTAIGRKHRVAASSVAIRHVLDQPGASVAIVGARDAGAARGDARAVHVRARRRDRQQIAARRAARGPQGDCYALERDPDSAHYKIMWRNQNRSGVPILMSDEFELYDLRVEVLDTGKPFVSHAKPATRST
jgi:aryl-alcohol dehydrogenase-like predicted oxidoreductase